MFVSGWGERGDHGVCVGAGGGDHGVCVRLESGVITVCASGRGVG